MIYYDGIYEFNWGKKTILRYLKLYKCDGLIYQYAISFILWETEISMCQK